MSPFRSHLCLGILVESTIDIFSSLPQLSTIFFFFPLELMLLLFVFDVEDGDDDLMV